ncbi:carbon storage regulator [Paenibacillus nanensis]|uniref:Translational regulator CsrA n=1 Tax=Paenibacillus nanensis TaxID=393251 RepID=A0A3A1UKV4_9BACL|nr:carbon storage regulator CsrA [Paenibacillus nanensis]RIX47299.1 carbon storage regulator [Paenibacillus nanensis]
MLVLSRKKGESVRIGENIEISVLEVYGDTVKIGISAPSEVGILRKELYVSVEEMNKSAKHSEISAGDLKSQFYNFQKKKE